MSKIRTLNDLARDKEAHCGLGCFELSELFKDTYQQLSEQRALIHKLYTELTIIKDALKSKGCPNGPHCQLCRVNKR